MNAKIFHDSIMPYLWGSYYDTTSGKMIEISAGKDTFMLVRSLYTGNLTGNYCTYTTGFQNNFFCVTFKSCVYENGTDQKIYGYLDRKRKLHLLLTNEEHIMDEGLMDAFGWQELEIVEKN
jgi:hypothetical protein